MLRDKTTAALVALFLLAALPVTAQLPEAFENLKVLPKDIDQATLVAAMRGFAGSLGVRCEHCHVGEAGKPLSTFDFASEAKAAKQTARAMMRMVEQINGVHLGGLPTKPAQPVEVACHTCHRGQARPRTLARALDEAMANGGLDAALEEYDALRERYFGRDTFDFSERGLRHFARGLAERGQHTAALRVLRRNVELFPEAIPSHTLLAQVYLESGDRKSAVETLEKLVAAHPDKPWLKAQLEEAKAE